MKQGEIVVVFVADKSQFIASANDIEKRNKQLSGSLDDESKAATARMSDRFAGLGAAIGTALKAGAVVAGAGLVASIKLAGDFEQSLNILKSVTGATGGQMTELSAKARTLGQDITLPGVSASDAAQAMTELGKAGLGVNDILAASKGVLSLAKAGQLDVADAATIASQALNAFKLKGTDATKVADILAAGSNASAAGVQDMALGLQQSAAVAGQFGVSLQDTVTALSLFANRGIQGSDAGTSLKTMLIALANPSKQATDLMKKLGFSAFDAQGNFVGLRQLAINLKDSMKGLTQEQQNAALATIFGTDAFRAASFLADSAGKSYDDMSKAVGKAGAATDLAAAQNSGFNGALDNLMSTLETIGTDIGTKLLPPLTALIQQLAGGLQPTVDFIAAHGKTLIAVLAAMATAFAAIRIAGFINDVKNANSALEVFVGAKNANGIKAIGSAAGATKNGIVAMGKAIGSAAGNMATFAADGISGASRTSTAWVSSAASTSKAWVVSSAKTIASMAVTAAQGIARGVSVGAAWVASAAATATNWVATGAKFVATQIWMGIEANSPALATGLRWVASAMQTAAAWVVSSVQSAAAWAFMVMSAVGSALSTAAAWVGSAAQSVAAWLGAKSTIVTSYIATSSAATTAAISSKLAWLSSAAQSAAGWVTARASAIGQFVAMKAAAVGNALLSSAAWVGSATKTGLAWLATNLKMLPFFVGWAIGAVANAAIATASWVAGAVATAAAWVIANAAMLGVWGLIIAAIVGAVALVIANWQSISSFFSGIFGAIQSAIGAVVDWVKNNWPLLLGILTGPIGAAIVFITQNWATISQFFSNLWAGIVNVATNIWNGLKGFFAGIWSAISSTVSGAWNGIKNAVVVGINGVVGFVSAMPGNILKALGNLGNLLIDAGKNLTAGLVKGIGNAAGSVIGKIKDICSGALDAVKNFFGIHSPSRVMEKMGDFLGQGFAGGIEGSIGAVLSAVDTVNNGVMGAFNDSLAPSLSASGNVSMSADDIWGSQANAKSTPQPQIVQQNYLTNGVTVDQVNRSLTNQLRRS